jgi:hypothetical protein
VSRAKFQSTCVSTRKKNPLKYLLLCHRERGTHAHINTHRKRDIDREAENSDMGWNSKSRRYRMV